jgi:hypothetical protein
MFHDFTHRQTVCFVEGIPEKVILSRDSKNTSIISREYLYNGLFAPLSAVHTGSMVEAEEGHFLVQTQRRTTEKDRYCSMIKTNVAVDVQRYHQEYDSNLNKVGGPTFQTQQAEIKGYCQYVTGRLRQEEPGLLSTTSYILILQTSVQVRKPQGLPSPDRILLNGHPYRVDVVDDLKYPNLLYVQLSEDTR